MSAEDCVGCRHINNCLGDCVGYAEPKPPTNFQRITQSEEALAEFISNITCECWGCKRVYSASCPHHKSGLTDFCDRESALEWLKQESNE